MIHIDDITDKSITRYIVIENGIIRCDIDKEKTMNACFVSNLVVDRRHRKNGNAAKLLQEAEKSAMEFGCDIVSLNARRGSWMLEWYKRFGYTPTIMWDEENVLMVKTLN